MEKKPILSLKNIYKSYPGVQALNGVSLDIFEGEVHALLGENGAGKSTLIKTISGAIAPDDGQIIFTDGQSYSHVTPDIAKEYGVEVIYQEFNLLSSLSIAENISFGNKLGSFVNYKKMNKIAKDSLNYFNVDLDPKTPVFRLTSSFQQIVEISKAISRNAKILIMDEPTAPLSLSEVDLLFNVIKRLREENVAIIYISHRMEELFEISDKVTVLRDGEFIKTFKTSETDREELVNSMVGRELKETFPKHGHHTEEIYLKVKDIESNSYPKASLEIARGEILGLSGLVGSGRTELARLIYGADRKSGGEIIIDNKNVSIKSPGSAVANGITYIPEDRKQHGCLLNRSISTNITLSSLKNISTFGFINSKKERKIVKEYADKLNIATPSLEQHVGNLSGGNQQKVVVAKSLAANSNIIIFDEPTRGIDVGAKQEIYKIICDLASEGNSILLISSEMEELIGLSDRILVLYEKKIVGELDKSEFDANVIMKLASGMEELNVRTHE